MLSSLGKETAENISTMQENSTHLSPNRRFGQTPWLVATILGTICFFMATWICISLLCYGFQHRKFSKSKRGFVLYLCATAAGLMSLAFISCILVSINLGFAHDESQACNVMTKVSVEMLVMSTSCVYLFLWVKQVSLYQSPALDHLRHKWIKAMSYMSILLMVVGQQFAAIVFNVLNEFTSTEFGCRYVGVYYNWPSLVASIVNAVGQVGMLFLLLYPFRYANQRPCAKAGMNIVKRTTATTLICVVTDAAAGFANGVFVLSSNHLPLAIYGCSAAANLAAVVLTFETWKNIIKSPLGSKVNRKSSSKTVVSVASPSKSVRDAESSV